jgi:hypothetical protein
MSATDGLFFWDYDDLDKAKRDAKKAITDFYEKSHDERRKNPFQFARGAMGTQRSRIRGHGLKTNGAARFRHVRRPSTEFKPYPAAGASETERRRLTLANKMRT